MPKIVVGSILCIVSCLVKWEIIFMSGDTRALGSSFHDGDLIYRNIKKQTSVGKMNI